MGTLEWWLPPAALLTCRFSENWPRAKSAALRTTCDGSSRLLHTICSSGGSSLDGNKFKVRGKKIPKLLSRWKHVHV